MDMKDMTPEQKDRFDRATLSLQMEQLRKELEEAKGQSFSPRALRDMSVCWAFIVSARGQIEGTLAVMPESVDFRPILVRIKEALEIIADTLEEAIEAVDKKEE